MPGRQTENGQSEPILEGRSVSIEPLFHSSKAVGCHDTCGIAATRIYFAKSAPDHVTRCMSLANQCVSVDRLGRLQEQ